MALNFLMVDQKNILQDLINTSRTTCHPSIFSCHFGVSQTIQNHDIIFQKSFNDSEIAHKTCSVLVGGVVVPYDTAVLGLSEITVDHLNK